MRWEEKKGRKHEFGVLKMIICLNLINEEEKLGRKS